jgi:hypothetical protein
LNPRTLHIVAAALALGLASSPIAQARDIQAEGVNFDDVAAWLRDQGQEATITNDGAGHKIVSTAISGVKFGVYLFDCKDDRCGSIQFAAGWPRSRGTDLARVNEWNRTRRWARAYLDKSNGIWVESDVDLTPGGTYELLNDYFATWKKTLDSAEAFFRLK